MLCKINKKDVKMYTGYNEVEKFYEFLYEKPNILFLNQII